MRASSPLIKCTVNDALVCTTSTIQPALLQFVNVMHPRLKRLAAGRHLISCKDQTEIWTVRRPKIWSKEKGISCLRSRTAIYAQNARVRAHLGLITQTRLQSEKTLTEAVEKGRTWWDVGRKIRSCRPSGHYTAHKFKFRFNT